MSVPAVAYPRSRPGSIKPAGVARLPPYPPLPPWSSLPFQFFAGSQTSKWISESLVGREVPATRQNSGTLVGVVAPGRTNGPAGTTTAVSTFVLLGSVSAVRPPQGVAAPAAVATSMQATSRARREQVERT